MNNSDKEKSILFIFFLFERFPCNTKTLVNRWQSEYRTTQCHKLNMNKVGAVGILDEFSVRTLKKSYEFQDLIMMKIRNTKDMSPQCIIKKHLFRFSIAFCCTLFAFFFLLCFFFLFITFILLCVQSNYDIFSSRKKVDELKLLDIMLNKHS